MKNHGILRRCTMDKASRVAQSMRDHVCRPRAAIKDKSIFGNILHDQCRRGVSTKMAGQHCEICDQLVHVWATPYALEQTTNARNFLNLSCRVEEASSPAIPLASLPNSSNQSGSRVPDFMFEPICLQSLINLKSPNNKRLCNNLQRSLQSICRCFKMYASSRQHLMQTPIRLSYFSMPFWRRTFEKTMERSNNFRSTAWLSCKACLSMVWFPTPPL